MMSFLDKWFSKGESPKSYVRVILKYTKICILIVCYEYGHLNGRELEKRLEIREQQSQQENTQAKQGYKDTNSTLRYPTRQTNICIT